MILSSSHLHGIEQELDQALGTNLILESFYFGPEEAWAIVIPHDEHHEPIRRHGSIVRHVVELNLE